MYKSRVCPICRNIVDDDDISDSWIEFDNIYHLKCLRMLEKEKKPFHEKYSTQKRISLQQFKDVLDLLNDKEFLEYWISVVIYESDQIEELYSHPILNELDLFP